MRLNAQDTTCALLKRRKLVSIAERLALAAVKKLKATKKAARTHRQLHAVLGIAHNPCSCNLSAFPTSIFNLFLYVNALLGNPIIVSGV